MNKIPEEELPANDVAEQEEVPGNVEAPAPEVDEVAELKDKLLRTLADMENLRRRSLREVEEARKYATSGMARDLLEVSDTLNRALTSITPEQRAGNEGLANLYTGIEMTQRMLATAFEKNKIAKIEPKSGEKFDHNRHQAMFEVPTSELPPGVIAETMQVGYVIADRLLRPAMVGVTKALPNAEPAPSGAGENHRGGTIDTEA